MPETNYSDNYLLYNALGTKKIVIAVQIEGLTTILTSTDLNKRVRYGDAGLYYGKPGLVYGGLEPYSDYKSILSLDGSSLTISQRLEPEQGRGAIAMLTLSFIDKDQFMTQLISPGVLLDDIMGKPVKIYVGYQEIAFPEDYTVMFRGRVSSVTSQSGRISLQFSDPNMVRRQQILYMGKTTLLNNLSTGATDIPVASNADFFEQILGPAGTYDPAIKTYIQIDSSNEIIEYPATGFAATGFTGCLRGSRGTAAATAAAGDGVSASIEITDHAIDMALKMMLSGWAGPYRSGITISSLVSTTDPLVTSQPGLIVLGGGKSADRDFGIAVGDYVTVSGSAPSGNNIQTQVLELIDTTTGPSNAIVTTATFTAEVASSAVMSVRSQYDTYPITCGVKLPGDEVDVVQHIYIKDTFMGSDENQMRFFFTSQEDSCKSFIESQLWLPAACYSLTRFGRISLQLTHAPLADERLQFLTGDNVQNPANIQVTRGLNNRKFFNSVNWTYDYDDAGSPASVLQSIDTDSVTLIGVSTVLPIDARGIRSEFGTQTVIDRRTNFLLSRYKNGALLLKIMVNWAVGSLIESGDVVAVKDGGVLQIANLVTGSRNLGTQLFEVINRELDMKAGQVTLELVSGLGADATDRYATISPSSVIQPGSSLTQIVIADSFGALFPSQEYRKWQSYSGVRIKIHDTDYVTSATATLTGLNGANPNILTVSGLATAPTAGMIVDIDDYSISTDPLDQQVVKAVHAYQSPRITITGGVSTSAFTVASGDIGKFMEGFPISVHNESFSVAAPETTVLTIDTGTNTVTAASSLGFTPASGYFVELLGFADGTASYRYI